MFQQRTIRKLAKPDEKPEVKEEKARPASAQQLYELTEHYKNKGYRTAFRIAM